MSGDAMANQGLSELKQLIEHWAEKSIPERIEIAEKVVALSMLSNRAQVRLQAAKIVLDKYAKPSGISGSAGEDDTFGDDDADYGTGFSPRPRKAL